MIPCAALLLKTDTLGDLVLFAPTLRALRAAWPAARLTVLIRRAYRDLAPLLADGVEWLDTTLDPFSTGPATDPGELARLRAAVLTLAPDLVATATSRANWLDAALAIGAPTARRVAISNADDHGDEIFSTQLRVALGIDAARAFPEKISAPPAEPDWRRNFRLASALVGRELAPTAPALTAPAGATAAAAEKILASLGLPPGRYVVCAAAGFANVKIKTWPAENFAAALGHLHARHQLRTLLVGHEGERAHLASIVSASRLPSPASPVLWLGRDGDLPLLAALLAHAALFLGNDTGALHLAAALDVPVVAVFGGGTWPRFTPAARRGVALVQPLPCFGCGWDCAFGDAPCLGGITVADATAALDAALVTTRFDVREISRLAPAARDAMGATAARYRALRAEHLARQHKLEELTALDREKDLSLAEKDAALLAADAALVDKDREIAALKSTCDDRERAIHVIDDELNRLRAQLATAVADRTQLEKSIAMLPPGSAQAAQSIANYSIHVRNIEAMLHDRDLELADLRATRANLAAGRDHLELAKHYGRLLVEKETVIRALSDGLAAREAVIKQLSAETTDSTADLRKLWIAVTAHLREKIWRPLEAWLFKKIVDDYWMQIGVLIHYEPRPLKWDKRLRCRAGSPTPPSVAPASASAWPQVAIVTPSYGQEKFVERTLRSVLDQNYPRLLYAVQDGASRDRSPEIISRHAARLAHWESVKDAGQADAIARGFAHLMPALAPDDVMAWLNSDDLLAPGAIHTVAKFFAAHPEVDVVYGHRLIIDEDDREVGRWIMPRHHAPTLEWIDYVPQETLFWRKRAWDVAGGIDPTFQFALDWDLLARFQQADCRIVRLPYFLGAFRVHGAQKTSQDIHTTGADEMARIRARFHGPQQNDHATINRLARRTRLRGALVARLLALGVRW